MIIKLLKFKQPNISLILNEIYEYQHENKRIEGLIDCETESQFDIALIRLGRKWDAIDVSETVKVYMV